MRQAVTELRDHLRRHPLWRVVWRLCAVAMTVPSIGACQKSDTASGADSILVDKEVLLKGTGGTPNAITRTPDGSFVIAGDFGTAWAVGTNSAGEVQWKFEESADQSLQVSTQSAFNGAVALTDGSVLLCGQKRTKEFPGGRGLVTRLDSNGHILEQRYLSPHDDQESFSAIFYRCMHWGDGIALIGTASNGKSGFYWLVKLDSSGSGAKEWEIVDPEIGGRNAVEMGDHSLLLSTFVGGSEEARLVRINRKGEVLAKRSIKASGYSLLRSVDPITDLRLVVYRGGDKPMLYTLDGRLQDAAPQKPISPIVIGKGCGYVLSDNSLALFGYVQKGGDAFTAPYAAAVARVARPGESDVIHVLDQRYGSFTVSDAIPLSANQFVGVHNRSSQDQNSSGIVMSWVTFK